MPTIRIPTPLRSYTSGNGVVAVKGATVGEAMRDLIVQYPALQVHLYNNQGELRPFVNLFIGEENVRDLQGLDTQLDGEETLMLLPSVAGGSGRTKPGPGPSIA